MTLHTSTGKSVIFLRLISVVYRTAARTKHATPECFSMFVLSHLLSRFVVFNLFSSTICVLLNPVSNMAIIRLFLLTKSRRSCVCFVQLCFMRNYLNVMTKREVHLIFARVQSWVGTRVLLQDWHRFVSSASTSIGWGSWNSCQMSRCCEISSHTWPYVLLILYSYTCVYSIHVHVCV